MNHTTQFDLPRTWSLFGALFVALMLVLGIVFVMHFYVDYRTEITQRESSETLNTGLARSALMEDIASVTSDLMFLSGLLEEISYDASQKQEVLRYMAEVFIVFAREKGLYDQIRFLNPAGREVVRVNWNNGKIVLVGSDQLQDKSKRYYVSQALGLGRDMIYLSPLDLNIEGGRIEQPEKPVLRFATPVFDANGTKQGLVILNYLGQRLLDRFRQVSANIADHIYLLNASGYWLSSPHMEQSWGFMYGREDTFQGRYPTAWSRIISQHSGQFDNEAGLFTFATVLPATEASQMLATGRIPAPQEQVWKVVSHIKPERDALGLNRFVSRHAPLYVGILLLMAALAYLVANAHVHRRKAEAQQAYEQTFRQTLEDIRLVALMVDLNGKLSFCNHYLLALTGWNYEEVIGRDWVSCFIPEEQQSRANELLTGLKQHAKFPHQLEAEIFTRAGARRLISWINTLSRDENGKVTGLTAIGEDITESRRVEEQVRKLSRAVDQSPASVIITSRDGCIEYVNPKFTRVTGYTSTEVVGKNPRMLKSGETPSEEYAELWRVLEAGGEWRGEFHNRRKDGSLYWEAAVISALRDLDGQITHFLAVKEDITERKRLEQEVDARNLELARAQALTTMGRMASMLAHDLSNPLSSVKMAVQLLGRQALGKEARELSVIGQEQVVYMEGIIKEMLTYARPGKLESSWLDPEKLLNGVLGTVQRRIIEYGVEVTIHCEPGLPTFPGDASKLRQLLSNLLVNALQATSMRPDGHRNVDMYARLVMAPAGHQLEFRVCDNGEGIAPELGERLFEPFYTTRAKGTGLGLAIVRQITDLHGGSVVLTVNQPQGTCAVISLPLTPAISTRQQAQVRSMNTKSESG